MEFQVNRPEEALSHYENKELIGIGSNGNRIYKAINNQDNKVK